jgi:penicillin-binding protein 1C
MGMTTLTRTPSDYGLTLILGGAEGTLWDLSGIYANLAHVASTQGGRRPRYRRVQLLAAHDEQQGKESELSAAAAWLTLEAMVEVTRPGDEGFWRSFNSSQKVAWKTGTSYGLRDAWAIGITPRYTVGVWAGNASGEGRPGLTGVTAAAPLLFDIFNTLEPSAWFEQPTTQMKQVHVCKDDGYLANGHCDSEVVWIPQESHFEQVTPYHLRIHLDQKERWRVDSRCETVDRMVHRDWFILPTGQAYYYRNSHPGYRTLPAWRSDCLADGNASADQSPVALLYPGDNARIYIPYELGGQQERTIFHAAHRDNSAIVHWHLDDDYLGTTQTFHQKALQPAPGMHTLTLVDENGQRLERRFEVIGKGE